MTTRSPDTRSSASSDALTALILRIFMANGRLLLAGDHLVAPLSLTSARWQLLGVIAAAERAQPVAQLARELGVTRQAVQRLANELESDGIVAFEPNPHHKRAQLVVLSERGQCLYAEAMALQKPWASRLASNLTVAQIDAARETLDGLIGALDTLRDAAFDGLELKLDG